MNYRKVIYTSLFISLLLIVIQGFMLWRIQNDHRIRIIFLDVGQGDATLIMKGNHQILIDGGRDGRMLLEKLGTYIPFWDRKLELVIATHPDQDHISGLVEALESYKVSKVMQTNDRNETIISKRFQEAIREEGAEIIEGVRGNKVIIGENEHLEVMFPFASVEDSAVSESNSFSLALKLQVESDEFLFMGDLPIEQEGLIVQAYPELRARVLKVGHHGSKYSTSQPFLDSVKPEIAVISVGANNTYGHPHPDVLDRLKAATILRTDNLGDVRFECQEELPDCIIY